MANTVGGNIFMFHINLRSLQLWCMNRTDTLWLFYVKTAYTKSRDVAIFKARKTLPF